jgi:hypothetical protein
MCVVNNNWSYFWGTRWRSWLRHCATSRKVAGSIPDGVISIFQWHDPCDCTMALGSSQLLSGIIHVGKGGQWVGLTALPPSCGYRLEIWENEPVISLYKNCFTFSMSSTEDDRKWGALSVRSPQNPPHVLDHTTLAPWSPVVNTYTTRFSIQKFYILSRECMYVFGREVKTAIISMLL